MKLQSCRSIKEASPWKRTLSLLYTSHPEVVAQVKAQALDGGCQGLTRKAMWRQEKGAKTGQIRRCSDCCEEAMGNERAASSRMDRGIMYVHCIADLEMMRKKKSVRMCMFPRIRQLTSAEKEKRRIERGLPDQKIQSQDTFNHNFMTRDMLRVPRVQLLNASQCVTIMTYNVLAQSLIRRRLFPSSGI